MCSGSVFKCSGSVSMLKQVLHVGPAGVSQTKLSPNPDELSDAAAEDTWTTSGRSEEEQLTCGQQICASDSRRTSESQTSSVRRTFVLSGHS